MYLLTKNQSQHNIFNAYIKKVMLCAHVICSQKNQWKKPLSEQIFKLQIMYLSDKYTCSLSYEEHVAFIWPEKIHIYIKENSTYSSLYIEKLLNDWTPC